MRRYPISFYERGAETEAESLKFQRITNSSYERKSVGVTPEPIQFAAGADAADDESQSLASKAIFLFLCNCCCLIDFQQKCCFLRWKTAEKKSNAVKR